jgi:hypothetical protein
MRPSLAALAAACLAAGCAHGKAAPPADAAVPIHGRILTEDADHFGVSPTSSPTFGYYATTPMAGKCSFSSCLENGWTTATPEGNAVTRCNFGDCARNGWVTAHPNGTRSETRCNFGDCFKDGWVTTHDDGATLEVRCGSGDCMKNGWSAVSSSGQTAQTRCSFGDCDGQGWTTQADARSVECRCTFRDCRKEGAECREQ